MPATRRIIATTLALLLASLPVTAEACTVCMGDPASKTAGAINAAMFLMIGFIGSILASLVVFGFYLSRRAAAPLPPHAEFGGSDGDGEELHVT